MAAVSLSCGECRTMTYHRIMHSKVFGRLQSFPTAFILLFTLLLIHPNSAAAQCDCSVPCIEITSCACQLACAATCFPEEYPEGPCIPLDGGLSLLVVGGLAYGARSARRRREQQA